MSNTDIGSMLDDASFHFHNNDYDQSLECYNQALADILLDYVSALGNRGVVYVHMDSYDEAIEDFNEVIKLDPDNGSAYYWRGQCYRSKGEYDKAIDNFTQSLNTNSNSLNQISSIYLARGACFAGEKKYQLAITDYTKAIELDPGNYRPYSHRAAIYLQQEELAKAKSDIEMVLKLCSDHEVKYRLIENLESLIKKLERESTSSRAKAMLEERLEWHRQRRSGQISTSRHNRSYSSDSSDSPRNTCYLCEGRGQVVCPQCFGNGRIVPSIPCSTCGGMGTVPCSVCKAAGYISS